jgi:hypothetical protein
MNIKIIRNIAIGIGAYAIFVTLVVFYYQDNPEARSWDDREGINQSYISRLSLDENVNKEMIIETLGTPDISESKQAENGTVSVLFYRTQHIKSDGITTPDECTALIFKNNQLVAWGQNAYQQYKDEQLTINN